MCFYLNVDTFNVCNQPHLYRAYIHICNKITMVQSEFDITCSNCASASNVCTPHTQTHAHTHHSHSAQTAQKWKGTNETELVSSTLVHAAKCLRWQLVMREVLLMNEKFEINGYCRCYCYRSTQGHIFACSAHITFDIIADIRIYQI